MGPDTAPGATALDTGFRAKNAESDVEMLGPEVRSINSDECADHVLLRSPW